jgi:photosystem II stability/assembly factor-like uncharacterized protein
MKLLKLTLATCMIFATSVGFAQKKKKDNSNAHPIEEVGLSGLKFRNIGPALTSGRIADLAVNPNDHSEYYVAVACGGVWKTTNAGTTYDPIFDGEGSYSIGCVTIDPSNTSTVWVGTGENNNQRSVAYGDGVYKSDDSGKTWKHMGFKESEHIGKIVVDPRNSDIVYVAAYGPLWSAGGDRGLYKTTDGGKTWDKIIETDEHTGINDIILDPRNSDLIYAAAHQRRRRVFTYISGGPGSTLMKSRDGGLNWDTVANGFASGDLGRIGLAISPVNPDYVFAIVEGTKDNKGFYRSTNRGASWKKMSSHTSSGNYYTEIVPDPIDLDRVYSMETWGQVTNDGGATWQATGEKSKHVDNHCMWIDPSDNRHMISGCDGGLYETWDLATTWQFKANLPVTQFYKVTVDNDAPFYNVYGGTQDNFSLGGPSRTTNAAGINNADWFITNGGDGFESAVDWENPDIVYAQAQYGWLVRYDKASGEAVGIQPMPGKGEAGYRWNWDAPLLVSPHKSSRLYFAANKVFCSDDRGDTWKTISGDLTQQLDRNTMPVMGKVWSMDAIMKNKSTTIFGNIVALDESPKKEGLLYAGTDDGLIQVTEDKGVTWKKMSTFPGVPKNTYVNMVLPSQHAEGTVFAAFNNHKNGDFKPYLLKSTDKGASWTNIAGNLPERGSVYCIAEDHIDPNLLFAGTEFGCFFSVNGGKSWKQLKAGLPTIAIRDIAIQRRENDLVLASFGRGFYVLDDYTPLRNVQAEVLEKAAHIFPIKDALMYIEATPLGLRGKAFQGESYWTTPNPKVGAIFTYFVKEAPKSLKKQRQDREKKAAKDGEVITYPTFAEMEAEDNEEDAYLIFTVKDQQGNVVRKLTTKASAGLQRITWDFRYPTTSPVSLKAQDLSNVFASEDVGHLAMPGTYTVEISQSINRKVSSLNASASFVCKTLNQATMPAADKAALLAFQQKVGELSRALDGAGRYYNEMSTRMKYVKEAIKVTPDAPLSLMNDAKTIELRMHKLDEVMWGDGTRSSREFETPPAISDRVGVTVYNLLQSTSAPSQTAKDNYRIATEEFPAVLTELKSIASALAALESKLEQNGAPWTPGRLPKWEAQ